MLKIYQWICSKAALFMVCMIIRVFLQETDGIVSPDIELVSCTYHIFCKRLRNLFLDKDFFLLNKEKNKIKIVLQDLEEEKTCRPH